MEVLQKEIWLELAAIEIGGQLRDKLVALAKGDVNGRKGETFTFH